MNIKKLITAAALLLSSVFLESCKSPDSKIEVKNSADAPAKASPTVTPVPPIALTPTSPPIEIQPPREFKTPGVSLPPPPPIHEKPEVPSNKSKIKIALILGPGGLRSYAHAGVLGEIHRSKMPIFAIGGLEAGAFPAALYSNKPQAFEAEWQMMKLKEEDFFDSSLVGGRKPKDLKDWQGLVRGFMGGNKIEDGRMAFGCITVHLDKNQPMVIAKGTYDKFLPYCLGFPPLYKPLDRQIAGANQLNALVQHFRSKGANYFIYVDLLSDNSKPMIKGDDNLLLWNVVSSSLQTQMNSVNEVIRVPLTDELTSFASRRDMVQKGRESSAKVIQSIMSKLGLD